ncbi:MAG TPA: fused MFS/spermidine synthase [Xanthobacteraceae bacterium]|nr:fused MFS/spermidine synthase [Xanthobacteraceae bacterium]
MAFRKERQRNAARAAPALPNNLLLALFALAIFLSAALLFAVQPMFTKLVLPRLGGSPSVWSVAMVFFQAALLAGYTYAHLITRCLSGRQSITVHVALLLLATLALPLAIPLGWGRPPASGEALYLIGLFAVSIGLPFFALAANAPLLQAWFAKSGHPLARDPYFLYAASNVGSFLALLSYPLLVEPLTRLSEQTLFWAFGFYALILLIALCGAAIWRSADRKPPLPSRADAAHAPGWKDALIWIALAAVPAAFLIAVTAHISTDVAAAPLLWVLPLALYLATFVIVFQRRPIIPHGFALAAQLVAVALLIGVYINGSTDSIFTTIFINLAAFFFTALVCHGELARRRPAARYLTEFYLWMSFGGMIGGISAGLIAPNVFNWVAEYPLLIVLGLLCRPGVIELGMKRERLVWLVAIAVLANIAVLFVQSKYPLRPSQLMAFAAAVLLISIIFLRDPLKFAAVAATLLTVGIVYDLQSNHGESVRNFFGVHKIYDTYDGYRVLLHGTTIHGAEKISDEENPPPDARPVPLTYYHANSSLAQIINAMREKKPGPLRVGVIGLGTGSIACHAREGDAWSFYEIDQSIVDVATDPGYFTFYASCTPDAKINLGDARLTLADADNGGYDLIVVDAFTSDAIPVHLLTREAMALYLAKLAPGGIVAMHISNRHLELGSVVAGIAQANGLVTRLNSRTNENEDSDKYLYSSTVAACARRDVDFGALAQQEKGWVLQASSARVWTDDYSNIVGAMLRNIEE